MSIAKLKNLYHVRIVRTTLVCQDCHRIIDENHNYPIQVWTCKDPTWYCIITPDGVVCSWKEEEL